jgi:acetolactate synthase-1/3 small subunit
MSSSTNSVTFELKVRDIPGVLVRVAHAFARRGHNIRSLHVEPIPNSQWSKMTIVAADAPRLASIAGILEKLVDVASVTTQA